MRLGRLPHFTLAGRITLGFAMLVCTGLVVSGLAIVQARMTDQQVTLLSELSHQKDRLVAARDALAELQSLELRFRLDHDPDTARAIGTQADAAAARLAEATAHATDDTATTALTRLHATLAAHAVRATRFIRLTRSADAARDGLFQAGDELGAAAAELIAAPEPDAAGELYAAHLLDRKIQQMRQASLQYLTVRDRERIRIFYQSVASLRVILATASTAMDQHAELLPPLAVQIKAYAVHFAIWTGAAMQAEQSDEQDLRPQIEAARASLRVLDDSFSQSFAETRIAAGHATAQSIRIDAAMAAVGLAMGMVMAAITVRSIITPLRAGTTAMQRLAAGDLDVTLPYATRRDEVGAMAQAFAVFRENARQARTLSQAQRSAQQIERDRGESLARTIEAFEGSVDVTLAALSGVTGKMESTAHDMAATAVQTNAQSLAVHGAAEQTTTSVQTVAEAAGHLIDAIHDISEKVSLSASVAERAVAGATRTNDTMHRLAGGVKKIGEVVHLINSIANQTNLLALNATIEAARAGPAGKGFAVVAGEVKALATQTSNATGEIAAQIAAIQTATQEAVSAIAEITAVIAELSQIGTAVAGSIERQGSATADIARHAAQAAQAATGTRLVSLAIDDVREAAGRTGLAASGLHQVAADVSRQSAELTREVQAFTGGVRAAG